MARLIRAERAAKLRPGIFVAPPSGAARPASPITPTDWSSRCARLPWCARSRCSNLGRQFEAPRAQWGPLAGRIEALAQGQLDLISDGLDPTGRRWRVHTRPAAPPTRRRRRRRSARERLPAGGPGAPRGRSPAQRRGRVGGAGGLAAVGVGRQAGAHLGAIVTRWVLPSGPSSGAWCTGQRTGDSGSCGQPGPAGDSRHPLSHGTGW